MNRKEFLNTLRKRLSFLKKEDLEKEVLFYINKIDSSKEDDKVVIESFGSMDKIAQDAAKKYKTKIVKKEIFVKRFYHELVDLSTVLKNSDSKERSKILLDLLLLIIITCILKIPFIFLRDIGDKIIEVFFNQSISFLAIWGLLIELSYVVVALTYFVKTFEKWFTNIK